MTAQAVDGQQAKGEIESACADQGCERCWPVCPAFTADLDFTAGFVDLFLGRLGELVGVHGEGGLNSPSPNIFTGRSRFANAGFLKLRA